MGTLAIPTFDLDFSLERDGSLPAPLSDRIEQLLGPPAGARTWISATPFVPPRFLRRRGANTLVNQINAELASRNLSRAEEVEVLPWVGATLGLRHYVRRRRRGGPPPPADLGYALRLRLTEPINGPLTLGYGCHFGLGRFGSEAER